MYYSKFFNKFRRERNVRDSTVTGYLSSIKKYEDFHRMSIDELIMEALNEEDEGVPLKERMVKQRLLRYRTHLLKSKLSQNTVRGYFVKVKI